MVDGEFYTSILDPEGPKVVEGYPGAEEMKARIIERLGEFSSDVPTEELLDRLSDKEFHHSYVMDLQIRIKTASSEPERDLQYYGMLKGGSERNRMFGLILALGGISYLQDSRKYSTFEEAIDYYVSPEYQIPPPQSPEQLQRTLDAIAETALQADIERSSI